MNRLSPERRHANALLDAQLNADLALSTLEKLRFLDAEAEQLRRAAVAHFRRGKPVLRAMQWHLECEYARADGRRPPPRAA